MARTPDLIDALVTLLRADPTFADVVVVDGPLIAGDKANSWVIVGFDGDPSGDGQAATELQDWSGMSSRRAREISVPIAVVHGSGDTEVKPARDATYALGDRVEAALRTNPAAGLPIGTAEAAITSGSLFQEQTPEGIRCRLLLTLTCRTFGA